MLGTAEWPGVRDVGLRPSTMADVDALLVRFGCPLARVPAGPLSLNEWQPMARSPPSPRPE